MKDSLFLENLRIYTAVLYFAATSLCCAQSTSDIFARLDRAAQSFNGATAAIRVTTHTGIINEDEVQLGTVTVKRHAPDQLHFLIKFTGEDAQAIAYRGRRLEIFYPKLNTVREYDIGKYKDLAQKLILLGFGMPGRELAANYDIRNLGDEKIQGQDSTHLRLTPKATEVLEQLSRVDLWISLKNDCPLQQKFDLPGGDYRLVTYSDVKVNPHLPPSALDLPKDAKRERMN
jgi:outer membrane lipoprotein-sorting protein